MPFKVANEALKKAKIRLVKKATNNTNADGDCDNDFDDFAISTTHWLDGK